MAEQLTDQIAQIKKEAQTLMDENPHLYSISYELSDFPVDEVEAVAKSVSKEATFSPHDSRVGFCLSIGSRAYVHVRSVEVTAKVTYS